LYRTGNTFNTRGFKSLRKKHALTAEEQWATSLLMAPVPMFSGNPNSSHYKDITSAFQLNMQNGEYFNTI
jgi:hypothetical protein